MPERATARPQRGGTGAWTRHALLSVVALAAVALAAACRTGSPEGGSGAAATQAGPVGCWELEVAAEGARRDSVRAWLPAGEMPYMIELDGETREAAGAQEEWYAAYSWFDGRRETAPFSVWRRIPGDSVLVQRAGAMGGLALRLAPADDGLVGSVVGFSDVRAPGPQERSRRQAPVRGTRAACP